MVDALATPVIPNDATAAGGASDAAPVSGGSNAGTASDSPVKVPAAFVSALREGIEAKEDLSAEAKAAAASAMDGLLSQIMLAGDLPSLLQVQGALTGAGLSGDQINALMQFASGRADELQAQLNVLTQATEASAAATTAAKAEAPAAETPVEAKAPEAAELAAKLSEALKPTKVDAAAAPAQADVQVAAAAPVADASHHGHHGHAHRHEPHKTHVELVNAAPAKEAGRGR